MARASELRDGIFVTTLLVVVILSGPLLLRHPKACPLSLVFERYDTEMDLDFDEVAFLWLTNASEKTYRCAMTGNTSTRFLDTPIGFGPYSESFMVACEFRDQTPGGITKSTQPASFRNPSQSLVLTPHSAVRLRVALPPEGQKRKVAVLCEEQAVRLPRFWFSKFGLSVLRTLPREVQSKVIEPAVLRVWCAQELSHPDERRAKK